jgi:hypothetical protein
MSGAHLTGPQASARPNLLRHPTVLRWDIQQPSAIASKSLRITTEAVNESYSHGHPGDRI